MTREELWSLVEKLYFDYETENVSVDISDGNVTITVKTFFIR